MPLANLKVQLIVGGCDLEHAGAEVLFDGFVGDDGYGSFLQGANDVLALEPRPTFIIRVYGHGDVAHDGFRTSGGYLEVDARCFHDLIANLVEDAILRFHDDLLVGKGSEAGRTPIYHTFAPIHVTPLEQFDETAKHSLRIVLVQGVSVSFPVARTA